MMAYALMWVVIALVYIGYQIQRLADMAESDMNNMGDMQ